MLEQNGFSPMPVLSNNREEDQWQSGRRVWPTAHCLQDTLLTWILLKLIAVEHVPVCQKR